MKKTPKRVQPAPAEPAKPQAKSDLTLEEKRQSLYASLLRFSPEAGSLRDRALDSVVLAGLLGSSAAIPYKIGAIQNNLRLRGTSSQLRVETIQEALARLVTNGKVAHTEFEKKHAYYLNSEAAFELQRSANESSAVISGVIERTLSNTSHLVAKEVGARVFRTFLAESLARFGREIASDATGRSTIGNGAGYAGAKAAFKAASKGQSLTPEAQDSLESRCMSFLKSTHPDDLKLKLHLTQGYYFAELVGLDGAKFNPLADKAFAGTVFYLDTNVILPRLLSFDTASLFDEMLVVARRVGIQLRITRATINEIRHVTVEKISDIKRVAERLPDALASLTSDEVLEAFINARKLRPNLTPEEFFEPFDRLAEVLATQGIEIDDRAEVDTIALGGLAKERKAIDDASIAIRGRPKPEPVLQHDLCHFALISEERKSNPKTWFLTRDRALVNASTTLAGQDFPVCFAIAGFLQGISPFVTTAAEEKSIADVFSSVLEEQAPTFPSHSVFELRELKLIAEMHEDVLQTPPEQLVQAFDFVKTKVLNGRTYTASELPVVALGLKKFLASSSDEEKRGLAAEAQRLTAEITKERETSDRERERRAAAEAAELVAHDEKQQLMAALAEEKLSRQREHEQQQNEIARLRAEEHAGRQRLWFVLTGMGFLFAAAVWVGSDRVPRFAMERWPGKEGFITAMQAALRLLGLTGFVVPLATFTARTSWRFEVKLGIVTLVIVAALIAGRIFSDSTWSLLASVATVAALIALPLLWALSGRNGRTEM